MVDGGQHLRARTVVLRKREHAARLLAPLPEDLHVRVAEAVDGLEFVTDEEELLALLALGEQVDDLALEPVGVLELVDHDRAEAPALALAHGRVVAEQVAGRELEILEVEPRLPVLRCPVREAEAVEKLLQQVAVAGGQIVERRLLDAAAGLLVAHRSVAPRLQLAEVEQPLRERSVRQHFERASRRRAGGLPRLRVGGQSLARPRGAPRSARRGRPAPPARARAGVPPRAASRERPSASAGARGRRTSRADRAAPRRRPRRTRPASGRTPLAGARAPAHRRALGSAGRSPRRTGARAGVGCRSRGWSRSRPRPAPGPARARPASTRRARMRSRSSPAARSV